MSGPGLQAALKALVAEAGRPATIRLRDAVERIHAAFPRHQWTGVYLLRVQMLDLGPYVGAATDHTRIPVGTGMCGKAVAEGRDLDIADVHAEPGYLACSLNTKAEAIALIRWQGRIVGQLDVDSDTAGLFGAEAMQALKAAGEVIAPLVAEVVDLRSK
jgi:GAF domain-containing protein